MTLSSMKAAFIKIKLRKLKSDVTETFETDFYNGIIRINFGKNLFYFRTCLGIYSFICTKSGARFRAGKGT